MTDYKMRRQIMVDTQVRPSDVTKFPIIDALLNVPREKFVPDGKRSSLYRRKSKHRAKPRYFRAKDFGKIT